MRLLITGLLIGFAFGVVLMAEQNRRERQSEQDYFFGLADDLKATMDKIDQREKTTNRFIEETFGGA